MHSETDKVPRAALRRPFPTLQEKIPQQRCFGLLLDLALKVEPLGLFSVAGVGLGCLDSGCQGLVLGVLRSSETLNPQQRNSKHAFFHTCSAGDLTSTRLMNDRVRAPAKTEPMHAT